MSKKPSKMPADSSPAKPAGTPLAELSPAYFGMVMATGIVSLAADMMAMPLLANALLVLNCLFYLVLWGLTLLRMAYHGRRVATDLIDHSRGPGFFTLVAGTCILGSQFVLLTDNYAIAKILWVLSIVLWLGLTYSIFTGFTVKAHKPSLQEGISGAWLLAIVATQSVAVLGTLLAVHIEQPGRLEINFFALSMWLWGGMLYIWMMSLIFFRYTFFPFSPADLSPPYWINMGAMAISTLGGALLIQNAHEAPFLLSLLPFIKGFTVFYWATGTWWIPMLLILGVWRHVYKRFPLRYDPLYWGAVFPLGMYAVSSQQMINALEFDFLWGLPKVFTYVALGAWALVFAGFVGRLVTLLKKH
jgi:tellurite resistance protein TehA-like permease